MSANYVISMAARVPATVGVPSLIEIDRLVVRSFNYTEELNRPGMASLVCPISSLSSAAKSRLADLKSFPSEAWIYRDGVLVWAGEIQTGQISEQDLTLTCAGLLGYTFRMGVTSDLIYTGIDQFSIAKGLIDHWQSQAHGHYGLITTGIGTSGVVRDRKYLASELNGIGQRLQELGAVIDGFDTAVDPLTRAVQLSYPQRGIDLTASVILDKLNIDSASISLSVAPGDLVTDVSATGTGQGASGTQITLTAQRANAPLRASYGRSWGSQNFDGVTVQSTLDGSADAYLGARNGAFFQPGVSIIPRIGASPGDFHAGDTLAYAYDAGLGLQSGNFRVAKINVTVDASAKERMALDFT